MCAVSREGLELINQYKIIHSRERYGQVSSDRQDEVLPYIDFPVSSIVDYGCGRSQLADNIAKTLPPVVSVIKYDPAIPEYSQLPVDKLKTDLGICTDVLEHIPEADIHHTLRTLKNITERWFLTVCVRPAYKVLPNGKNAHVTVKRHDWWFERIYTHFPGTIITKIKPEWLYVYTWYRFNRILNEIDKPVMLVMAGPSVAELDENIEKFGNADCLWATVNTNRRNTSLQEKILSKIGRKLDFVYDRYLDTELPKNMGSLGNCLFYLIRHGAKEIYLFGADGGLISGRPLYYKFGKTAIDDLDNDTKKMNESFWNRANKMLCNADKLTKIVNISPQSKLDCFPKMPVSELIKKWR